MRLFPLDILMGIILALMLLTVVIGIFVFRGRRETGPLILMISGIIGLAGPLIHLLVQIEIITLPGTIAWIPVAFWLLGILFSVFAWRKKG